MLHNYSSLRDVRAAPDTLIREGTFFFFGGWVGWASASEGRVISNFFYKLGRVKPVLFATGDGHSFFWQGKNYSMSLT